MEPAIPPFVRHLILTLCGGLGLLMLFWRPGPNWWIGVRLPWTFADRGLWDKSWRLAALFLLGMGLGILVSFKFFLIALIHLTVLAVLYPAWLYRWKYGTWRFWKDMGWLDYRPVVRCAHCGHLQKLRDAGEAPVAVCEVCGHLCRSREHGRDPIAAFIHNLRRPGSNQGRRHTQHPFEP